MPGSAGTTVPTRPTAISTRASTSASDGSTAAVASLPAGQHEPAQGAPLFQAAVGGGRLGERIDGVDYGAHSPACHQVDGLVLFARRADARAHDVQAAA